MVKPIFNDLIEYHFIKAICFILYHNQMLPPNSNEFFRHVNQVHIYNTPNWKLFYEPTLNSFL